MVLDLTVKYLCMIVSFSNSAGAFRVSGEIATSGS